MEILFEDARLIAVQKSPGEIVVSGRNSKQEPLSHVLSKLKGQTIYPVHRLDKETSGVVIFAKEADTHRVLGALFESRQVKKTYWALARGPMEGEGNINLRLRVFGSGRVGVSEDGKVAQTNYRVLKSSPEASWLELSPLTGRKHQIRAHLYALGHPVLGDKLYGKNSDDSTPSLMLHALEISLKGWPVFRAKAPPDFLNWARRLFSSNDPA